MSSSSSSSSTTSMFDLPESLVCSILLRLPVKSLLRCRLVSKSLQSIITGVDFIHLHHQHNQDAKPCVLIYQNKKILSYFSDRNEELCTNKYVADFNSLLPLQQRREPNPKYDLVGQCSGVLCLLDSKNIYFWNPTIGAYKSTPNRGNFTYHFYRCMFFGFSYVPRIKDFKVVRILLKPLPKKGKKRRARVDVYTMSSDSWKRLENYNFCCKFDKNTWGDVVNGVFHWVAEEEGRYFILGFHMDDEVFHRIVLPEGNTGEPTFGNYKDCSLFACFESPTTGFDVWVMKEYGTADSWFKLINLSYSCEPMCFLENDQILVMNEYIQYAIYEMKIGRVKKNLQVMKYETNDFLIWTLGPYRENLFLLN